MEREMNGIPGAGAKAQGPSRRLEPRALGEAAAAGWAAPTFIISPSCEPRHVVELSYNLVHRQPLPRRRPQREKAARRGDKRRAQRIPLNPDVVDSTLSYPLAIAVTFLLASESPHGDRPDLEEQRHASPDAIRQGHPL